MPSENVYPFNCLMLQLDFPFWDKINKKLIPEDVLYHDDADGGYGREDEPHTTILYGIHPEINSNDIKQYLYPLTAYKVCLENISIFENENFDVVKFDVECKLLHKTNEKLCQNIPYTNDYPDYHPHVTIAYVKHGEGKQFVRSLSKPYYLTPKSFKYSYTDGRKEYFTK